MTSRDQGFPHPPASPDASLPRDRAFGFAFRLYNAVFSPVLHVISPSRCLYLPTCSEYAYTAVSRFGIARGSWLALRRLARCRPWGKGGLDPVPERRSRAESIATPSALSHSRHNRADRLP